MKTGLALSKKVAPSEEQKELVKWMENETGYTVELNRAINGVPAVKNGGE